jgi:nitroimidazol reductase NimA-like FMN-containing flavoprotein (pyridoxamine 5'-phosphate oxidase superfamily)
MSASTTAIDVLLEAECLALVRAMAVGRVAYSDRALPVVVPVNFALDGRDVVIRTARRSRLAAAGRGTVVAFEVDDIDVPRRSGWSVVITGRIEVVDDPAEIARLQQLELDSWNGDSVDVFVRLRTDILTGRRIRSTVP